MKQAKQIAKTQLNNNLYITTYQVKRGYYETYVFFGGEVVKCIETSYMKDAKTRHMLTVFDYAKHRKVA